MKIMLKRFGVMDKEIHHQQDESDHKKRDKGHDHLYKKGKPDGLVIKSGLQIENKRSADDKPDNAKSDGKLRQRYVNAQVIVRSDQVKEEDHAEYYPDKGHHE